MRDSISTEQWDEESGYKVVDQIWYQFRNSKKRNNLYFQLCIKLKTSMRHTSVGSQTSFFLVFSELLVFLSSKYYFILKKEKLKRHSKHANGMERSGYGEGK